MRDVDRLYGERGFEYELALASIGFGSLATAESYRAYLTQGSQIKLGIGDITIDTPALRKPPLISPAAETAMRWGGRVVGGVGVAFSAADMLDSSNSTSDRVIAGLDTTIGGGALALSFSTPLTAAVAGTVSTGYFAGRALGEGFNYMLDVGDKRSQFLEADELRDYARQRLAEKRKEYDTNCK